jgi:hypothetical protein
VAGDEEKEENPAEGSPAGSRYVSKLDLFLRGGGATEGTEEVGLRTEEGARRTVMEEEAVGAVTGGGEGDGGGAERFFDRRETLAELAPGLDLLWRPGVFP